MEREKERERETYTAQSRQLRPVTPLRLTLAPLSSSRRTNSTDALCTAICSGVLCAVSRAFTSAPFSSMIWICYIYQGGMSGEGGRKGGREKWREEGHTCI